MNQLNRSFDGMWLDSCKIIWAFCIRIIWCFVLEAAILSRVELPIWIGITVCLEDFVNFYRSFSFLVVRSLLYTIWYDSVIFRSWQNCVSMTNVRNDPILKMETTCGTLLHELQVFALLSFYMNFSVVYFIDFFHQFFLNFEQCCHFLVSSLGWNIYISPHTSQYQIIWDEVGESEATRDKMLLEVEQECLEVYRRKVDQANRFRAQLRQAIADSEAELAAICSAMGERPVHTRQVRTCCR